ncbi:Enoyl-CoA hydratase/carnithine racemase [Frankia canadensis]|uniref:Enoyl-CoA hydratase/carnithine racemase n=1 Tax=Frankia canadensis TaxID=1836972 RepID=A0A2I2KT01_9ACTN|nr:enoyl-CoA hydratase [Frankia canadensis]SNQ48798.1 Enoyl-CoA hydratase/carnithine racemase [Frankia canadensis]SOU56088.1 Enoyl-CoA hydratase/carnithine racemase [Frankia canadensis]
MSEILTVETSGTTRLITLNRPHARNALSGALVIALYDALIDADADPAVRAVVLTGADPAFCAGVDLKEAARDSEAYAAAYRDHDCFAQVGRMRTPIIAAVNGAAFTGGLEIAVSCDFLIASERAIFADSHVRVGILPGGGLTAHLPPLIGIGNARWMSMTGAVVGAEQALRMGLVAEVMPHELLRVRALELGAAIGEADPATMRELRQIYAQGAATYTEPARAAEARAALARPPAFDGMDERRATVFAGNRARLAASPAASGRSDSPRSTTSPDGRTAG